MLLEGANGQPGVLGILDKYVRDEIASEAYREWLMEYMSPTTCPACHGKRLKPSSLAVRVKGIDHRGAHRHVGRARARDGARTGSSPSARSRSADAPVDEIRNRLEFLVAVGLDYLSLERSAATLSGGEAQRIRLATQIGSKLRGVLYVLDEPSIGLHPRDNDRLLDSLAQLARPGQHGAGGGARRRDHRARRLRDRSGSGRGTAGRRTGGAGHAARDRAERRVRSPANICRARARSRSRQRGARRASESIVDPRRARAQSEEHRRRVSAGPVHRGDRRFGQRKIDAGERYSVPRGVARQSTDRTTSRARTTSIKGLDLIDKVIEIDQAPIGRTPRSNPATYTRSSRRSAICTRCCRNRASAATSRAASAST